MSARIFISRDSGALCVGAEEVATAFRKALREARPRCRDRPHRLARHVLAGAAGRSGDGDKGRVGYGPVKPADIEALLDAGMLDGKAHRLGIGLVDDYPWLKSQTRLTFKNCGIIDPRSLEDYKAHGGYQGLAKALAVGPEGDRRGGHHLRLARPRRRGLPHRHQMAHGGRRPRRSRNTSSATPTKAIPAPSPTA